MDRGGTGDGVFALARDGDTFAGNASGSQQAILRSVYHYSDRVVPLLGSDLIKRCKLATNDCGGSHCHYGSTGYGCVLACCVCSLCHGKARLAQPETRRPRAVPLAEGILSAVTQNVAWDLGRVS